VDNLLKWFIICLVSFRQNVKYETWISGYSDKVDTRDQVPVLSTSAGFTVCQACLMIGGSQLMSLVFGVGASFHLSYTVLKGNSHICRNKGTLACNFVPNSGLGGTFCFGKSIVETCCRLSSSKVDAQSVINWTVVGQLSWQYLRRPTASLSPVIVKLCPRHDSVARAS